jgi:hypothetical protein
MPAVSDEIKKRSLPIGRDPSPERNYYEKTIFFKPSAKAFFLSCPG